MDKQTGGNMFLEGKIQPTDSGHESMTCFMKEHILEVHKVKKKKLVSIIQFSETHRRAAITPVCM